MAFFICTYLFGFSRSEHPCPKTRDGFDPSQNAQVQDVAMKTWRGKPCLGLRLKIIKQDPRMERPEASGNEDWVYVGDVDDPEFSTFTWLQRVYAFHGAARPPTAPFFLSADLSHVLTYDTAMGQFRKLLARVSDADTAKLYGLHSLRVSGWNGARTGPEGEEVAVAHGGWHGGSQRRYDRFDASAVLGLPAVILSAAAHHFDDRPVGAAAAAAPLVAAAAPAPAQAGSSARKRPRGATIGASAVAPAVVVQPSGLPAGWQRVAAVGAGVDSFVGPNGQTARTLYEVRRAAAGWPINEPPPPLTNAVTVADLDDHVQFFDRPSARTPPRERVRS